MRMKKVYQYDKDGCLIKEWGSIASAANYFNADESSIRKAAKRNRKSRGFYWAKHKFTNLFKPDAEDYKLPKILVFDIETAPLLAFIWQLKTDYVGPGMLEKPNWWMISWSAKWLFEDEMLNDVVTSEEARLEDDSRILKSIWELVN